MRTPLRVAVALMALAGAAPAIATDFGQVEFVTGQVTLQTQDGLVHNVQMGETVPAGAELVTGADGELHIATTDSGYVALRPDTRLRVTEFRAEGDDLDTQVLALLRGTFRSITGWIGHDNPDRYRITTPAATIGIRGTDHEPSYWTEEDVAAAHDDEAREAGTYDKVNEGGSFIQNETGRVEITKGQAGFAGKTHARPTRLKHIPRLFRATLHEERIVERREMLKKVREQRRKERREKLKKRVEHRKERRERAERRGRPPKRRKNPGHEQD